MEVLLVDAMIPLSSEVHSTRQEEHRSGCNGRTIKVLRLGSQLFHIVTSLNGSK
jgi:hypothetical protein